MLTLGCGCYSVVCLEYVGDVVCYLNAFICSDPEFSVHILNYAIYFGALIIRTVVRIQNNLVSVIVKHENLVVRRPKKFVMIAFVKCHSKDFALANQGKCFEIAPYVVVSKVAERVLHH